MAKVGTAGAPWDSCPGLRRSQHLRPGKHPGKLAVVSMVPMELPFT